MAHPSETVVVGLQFGDEGKGQVVDHLAADHDVVVRFNGGANAGHTVMLGERRFALHQLPSGVLSPDKVSVIDHGTVVDPDGLLEEIEDLRAEGVVVGKNLRISERAHLVMPWHVLEDRIRGRTIGTTARGIGPCYADRAHRDAAFRVADLYEADALRERLSHAVSLKNATIGALAKLSGEPFIPFDVKALQTLLLRWADRIEPWVGDTGALLDRARSEGGRLLFEGAHAALLDVDHGTYPFVTSSSCVPPAAAARGRVIGVAKAYVSRVGNGPFPTEIFGNRAERLRLRGSEFGTTTGRPRRVGWLDLVALRHAARSAGVTEIALTGLAVLSVFNRVPVATEYLVDGRRTDRFPAHAAALARAEPVLTELPGWGEDVPESARELLGLVEARVAPVRRVAVGRGREDLIDV